MIGIRNIPRPVLCFSQTKAGPRNTRNTRKLGRSVPATRGVSCLPVYWPGPLAHLLMIPNPRFGLKQSRGETKRLRSETQSSCSETQRYARDFLSFSALPRFLASALPISPALDS